MNVFTQTERPFRVETTLGADRLMLESFTGSEGLSVPFHFILELISEDPAIDAGELLGSGMTLTLRLAGGGERLVHGRVSRFYQMGRSRAVTGKDMTAYRAEIVPWLWLLTLSSDCRIFQDKDVLEIVRDIFDELGYSDYEIRCSGSYSPREYCVQYRETHFAFVSRLMEEEGIFYYFTHSADRHVLVLADRNGELEDLEGGTTVPMTPSPGSTLDKDVVLELVRETAVHSTAVSLRDYDYLTPSQRLEGSASGDLAGSVSAEVFDYPGKFGSRGEGDKRARLRLEECTTRARQAHGTSNCRAFGGGLRFELSDHPDPSADGRYFLAAVHHEGGVGEYRLGAGQVATYQNQFTAIPIDVPYRPQRVTPRPLVHGAQTAVVVGPSGGEIHVDLYARVKLQFRWDRQGRFDNDSSCWVRVSSAWAGKGWGAIQLPRVGQEVLVDFLEGDPDRPIITGRVYNGEQLPAYPLPSDKTKSGMRSRSSHNGGTDNYNELTFEDKKGGEEILLRAERNLTILVKHDREATVTNDDTLTVNKNRSATILENDRCRVNRDRTVAITGADRLEVTQGRTESIGQALKVNAGTQVNVTAGIELKLVGPGGSIIIGPAGIMIESAGLIQIKGGLVKIN